MNPLKLCFDTSAVCKLFDVGDAVNFDATFALFNFMSQNRKRFKPVVSPIFWLELEEAPDTKLEQVSSIISDLHFTDLPYSDEAVLLTESYIQEGVLSDKHFHDLAHIAYAVIFCCDYFVSFDFRHIVRKQTQKRVQKVNDSKRYSTPIIVSPITLLSL